MPSNRFPFDSKRPVGYMIAVILEYITFLYLLNIAAFCGSLETGCFMFMISFTNDIQRNLQSMNENTKSKRKQRTQTPRQLIDFVEFHSATKQLS